MTTKEFVETGDLHYLLCGGGGILVLKGTGSVFLFGGSATPLEDSFVEFEADPEKFIYEHAPEYLESKRLFVTGKILYEDWKDYEEAAKHFTRSYALRGEEMFRGEDPKYLKLATCAIHSESNSPAPE